MCTESDEWVDLIEGARARVAAAKGERDGGVADRNAALEIVRQSAIALRDILNHGLMPDQRRVVFLHALLASLERIEAGDDPVGALHLRPKGRVRDEKLFGRELSLFVRVGWALDARTKQGDTRGDRPTYEAQKQVAKSAGQTIDNVKKVWQKFGGAHEWASVRDDWPKPEEK